MNKVFIILILLLYVGSFFPCDFFTTSGVICIFSNNDDNCDCHPADHEPPKTDKVKILKELKNKYEKTPLTIKALSNMAGIKSGIDQNKATKNISNDITIFMLWRQHPF